MIGDALQNIDEVSVGINIVQAASHDQTLHDTHMLGAELRPTEIPVLAAHRYRSERALEVVRIDRNIRVLQEDLQTQATLAHVIERLRERIARRELLTLELLMDPLEECIDFGFCVGEPV